MNRNQEKRELEIYKGEGSPGVSMTINDLVTLATEGFKPCGEDSEATGAFCASRKYSGDEECQCIRAVFPTQDYYELYKLMREYYLQNVGRGALARIAGAHIGDQ